MKRILLSLSAVILASCATGYQPEGFSGGFSEIPLSASAYKITVSGNGFTSSSRVQEMGLLRAAELSKMNGYDYFILADVSTWTNKSSYTTPGSSVTTTTGSANAYTYGNRTTAYGSASSYTTYTPPQTTTYFKPNAALVVQFVHADKAQEASALSVKQIYSMYAEKYGLIDSAGS